MMKKKKDKETWDTLPHDYCPACGEYFDLTQEDTTCPDTAIDKDQRFLEVTCPVCKYEFIINRPSKEN